MSFELWKQFKPVYLTLYIVNIYEYYAVLGQIECNFYTLSPVKANCGGCGICKIDESSAYCMWLVPSFLAKCTPVDFCSSTTSSCADSCDPMIGSFKCHCDTTRFGRLCENELRGVDPSSIAVVDDVIFPPVFPVNRAVPISLFISKPGLNLHVKFKSRFEFLSFNAKRCERMELGSYCERFHPDMVKNLCTQTIKNVGRVLPSCMITVEINFPGLSFYSYDKDDEIRDIENDVYALKETFGIEVFNNGETSRSSYEKSDNLMVKVLISPDINQCAPKVYLRNLGETMFNMLVLTTINEVTIPGSYTLSEYESCSYVDNIVRHWNVWRIVSNHNEISDKPIKEVFVDDTLYFAPFTLDAGNYKVKLNVSLWNGAEESFDYAYGYFSIERTDLIPVISGGAEQKLYYKIESITLDGSKSRNLNEKRTERGQGLTYFWTCDQSNPKCAGKYSEGSSITYLGPFEKNVYYVFTLTISSGNGADSSSQSTSQKIFMSESPLPFIEIICLRNCEFEKSNPNVETIFEAIIKHTPASLVLNTDFKWTYKKATDTNTLSVEEFRQKQAPNNVLVVPGGTLEKGELYTFQVEGGADNPGFAEYKIVMANEPTGFNCSVFLNGQEQLYRGVTPVSIKCDSHPQALSPVYTMYDKVSETEGDEEARILSTGKSNVVHNVFLTRGYVEAKVTNQYGLSTKTGFQYVLLDSKDTVSEHMKDLQHLLDTSDAVQRANKIAVIVDFIAESQFMEEYIPRALERFLEIAANDEISSLSFLKVWTSTTSQILNEGKKRNCLTMKSMNYLSKVLTNLSTRLLHESKLVIHDFLTQGLTLNEITIYSSQLIKFANGMYDQTDEEFRNKNVGKEKFYSLYSSYRESTDFLMQAVEKIMQSLILNVSPYALPVTLNEDKMFIWIKEDTPEYLSELSENKTLPDSIPSIFISKSLAKSISRQTDMLVVQMAQFQEDPYWWDQNVHISTNVVDLKMVFKKEREISEINKLIYPIEISLNNSFQEITTINGAVEQCDSNASVDDLDMMVKVHQLRVPNTGRLYITFLNLVSGQELKVLAMFNIRPDYHMLLKKGVSITSSSRVYLVPIKDPNAFDFYDLYFLGIIPGTNTPNGSVISYSFELSSSHCASRTLNEWSTRGCKVGKASDGSELDCECEHLSIFGGFSQVPINKVNPFEDYKLLVDIPNNPYVFIFIIVLLSIYLFLLIWTIRKDYEDRRMEGAIYLEDNFPYDAYPYLVVVYTGNKLFSGTSANIGIAIEGSESSSRHHVLRGSMLKVLRTGDDDWFLLFSPNYIGSPKLIHLWSDYSGWAPEWYCSKVIVVDLLGQKEYKFIVEAWLSLKTGLYVERYVDVYSSDEDQRLIVTIENMVFGFRETHLWVSVMSRHPRSTVSRAQRLSIAVGGLFITMLVSCMFYGVLDEKIEDYPEYTVTSREITVGFLSVIITALLINLLVSVFRHSFVFQITDEAEIEEEDDEIDEEEKKSSSKQSKASSKRQTLEEGREKSILYRLFRDVLKVLAARKRFVPVELNLEILGQSQKHSYHFRRLWSCVSWFFCISIICICSFLIILYGLKFGKVKSLQWLTSFTFGFLHMFFIATPMKIITLSAMSGMLASNLFEVVSYRIKEETIITYKDWYLEQNPDLEAKLISMRKQRAYIPLPYIDVSRKISRERKKEAIYKLIEMALIATVLVLTFAELETLWTTSHYWNNRQLRRLFRESFEEEGLQLQMIRNISEYLSFLRSDVLPVIYRTSWYNGQPFVKKSTTDYRFVFSGTSKLLGLPRLRQKRVKPGLCKNNVYPNLTHLCSFTFSQSTEDNDLYGEGWITSGPVEKFQASPVWGFTNESETFQLTLFGYTNTAYKAGGYVSDLAISRSMSDDVVIYLDRENWLDKRAKAVIFELSLYSAFSGTLSWLISITETLHMGMLTNVLYVYSVSQDYGFIALDFIFLASFFGFAIRVLLIMNRNGVTATLFDFWTLFEVALMILAVSCIYLLAQNVLAVQEYLHEFLAGDTRDRYFQFQHLVSYLIELRIVMVFLILFIACRFMKSWLFGKNFIPYFRTLMFCWSSLFWIFLVYFLSLFSYWRIFSYLLNSFMLAKNNFVLISKIDFKLIVFKCVKLTCKINPYVLCSIANVLPLIIIMYFTQLYKIIKRKNQDKKDVIDFCSVFCKKNTNMSFHGNMERNQSILRLT